MKERITLALVTYNQADLLREFLAHYKRFGFGKTHLLVVDDGSTDATSEILSQAESTLQLRHIRITHGGSARARNEALFRCRTEWIAFSDTDCVLDDLYFEKLEEIPFRFATSLAVEGAIMPPLGFKPPFTHSVFNPNGGSYATANMAFRVEKIIALEGFDEHYPNGLREDVDLALTLLEQKELIPFWPEWKVCHPHIPRKFINAFVQAWPRHAHMLIAERRLYQKHPKTYSLVRRHQSAQDTFNNWCQHWSWLYVLECRAYFKCLGRTSIKEWKFAFLKSFQAIFIAGWEQLCIIIWCFRHKPSNRASS